LSGSKIETLFEAICHIAIEFGQFGMAWIGLVEKETGCVIPAYVAYAAGNSTQAGLSGHDDDLFSQEPLAPALVEGQLVTYDDIEAIPGRQAWGEAALKRGFHSAAVVPLTLKGQVIGSLSLYAAPAEHFTIEEQSLLQKLA
jgi:GAF domain-containing protein